VLVVHKGVKSLFKFTKPIQITLFISLVLVIVLLYTKVSFLFTSLYSLLQLIFVPVLLALFCYYLLRPIINVMMKFKINKLVSILSLFVVISALLVWFILAMIPMLQKQFISLVNNAPSFFVTLGHEITKLQQHQLFQTIFPEAEFKLTHVSNYITQALTSINNYMGNIVSIVSNFTIVLVTAPIMLFFLLKDGHKFSSKIEAAAPIRYRNDVREMFEEFDHVLSSFIVGRVLVNIILGVLMYVGFIIIDLPYALLLTTIAVIANFIPFIGAILSTIPIAIIALVDSPMKAVWSVLIILAAQQIQDNLIAPYIFGKQLNIHPLTTIILVIGAGKIGGIIAMIIIIPSYLIIKIIAVKVYNLFFREKWEQL